MRYSPIFAHENQENMYMCNRIQRKIIQEATNSFMLYGVKCTSMDMIATSIHISKRTLYEYQPSKKELLKSSILSTIGDIKNAILKMEEDRQSSLEIILNINYRLLQQALSYCPAFYKDIKYYPDILEIIEDEFKIFIRTRMLAICNRAVEEGYIISDYNFGFLFSFFETNLYSFYNGPNLPLENQMKVFRHTIQVYLSGICTDAGRDLLKQTISQKE